MTTTGQRRSAALLVVFAVGYWLLFIPPNLTGSADANMLAAFEVDEFSQYHVLWSMTSGGDAQRSALSRFVQYDHYYYGFPFYLSSAAAFWPLRARYVGGGAPGLTRTSLLVLRQLSPLFMLLAIGVLVYAWTEFRSPIRSVGAFAFAALPPAVVANNLWWHPDSLVTLFVAMTIAALALDRGRLGRWFTAAALCCGLATGTKLIGVWFAFAVALHLWRQRARRGWPELALHGARFAAVMAVAVVVSNPQLLVPGEAREVFETLAGQGERNAFGWNARGEVGAAAWYAGALRDGFGFWWTHALLLGFCVYTARTDPRRRDLALTTLAWVLPLTCYLLWGVAHHAERYFLPVFVPLAACIAAPLPWRRLRGLAPPRLRFASIAALSLSCAVQLAVFAAEDGCRYRDVLAREDASPSLAFYRALERDVLSGVAPGVKLRIFRDAYIYLPPRPEHEVHLRWHSAEHRDIAASHPDLILLRTAEIERFGDASVTAGSFDPDRAERSHRFYRDVRDDALPGYRRLMATDFAVALGRIAPEGRPRR